MDTKMGHGFSMMGGMFMMWPLMFLFLALAIAGLVALILVIIRLARNGTDSRDSAGARRILDERYARGEIDDDEYRRRRNALN